MATLSNGQLAQRVNTLVEFVQSRHGQLDEWMNGVTGGGDFSNGTYPLTDYLDNTEYIRSPAQLESEVNGLTGSASASATAAEEAHVQAVLKAAEAALAEANTLSFRDSALAAQGSAETARDSAINAQVNAIAQKESARYYSDRAFDLVDSLGALGSYSVDYGRLTDLIITIFTNGADFGLISLPHDATTEIGPITQPHNQTQNVGYL